MTAICGEQRPKRLIECCLISLDIDRLMTLEIIIPGGSSSQTIY